MKQTSKIRYGVVAILLVCVNAVWGQGVYTYKNLKITASCDKGPVSVNGDTFEFQDSIVSIGLQMNERTVSNVIVKNLYNKPIVVKWKRICASNNDRDFYSYPESYFVDSDRCTGEDKLYKGELHSYILNNWTGEMFSKKKNGQKGKVSVSLVVDDELIQYIFNLNANPQEK